MLYVRLTMGFGNQLFQYALYRELEWLKKDVLIDESAIFDDNKNTNIRDVGIKYNIPDSEEMNKMQKKTRFLSERIKKRLFNKGVLYKQNETIFDYTIFEKDNCILVGYWQSEKYFKDIKESIKNDIKLDENLGIENVRLCNEIENCESVSIHIRGGDYLDKKYIKLYGGICNEDYYYDAISYIKSKVDNASFYLFSDDKTYATSLVNRLGEAIKYNVVDINLGKESYKDMYLMSRCKHNIIANSSFSWWGSYLNKNENKMVIAPQRWLQNINDNNIYYNGMILL